MEMLDRHQPFDNATIERFNALLDLLAEVSNVPSALLMRAHAHEIEVLASASTPDSPYEIGGKEPLNSGLYCETVMAKRAPLLIPDATQDPAWDKNPDSKLGMISYLGFPLEWPDGVIFGTICVLDQKQNAYSDRIHGLLSLFKGIAENQLALIFEMQQTKEALNALQANRKDLSEAVRLAVDATARNANVIRTTSKALSEVLGDLTHLLDSRLCDDGSFNEWRFKEFQAQVSEITDRLHSLSGDISAQQESSKAPYKKRRH